LQRLSAKHRQKTLLVQAKWAGYLTAQKTANSSVTTAKSVNQKKHATDLNLQEVSLIKYGG